MDFNRDVRPILSERCYTCHGPDEGKRQAKLRLDVEADAKRVIAVGKPAESLLIQRVTATTRRMPPVGAALTARELDVLSRWIAQGARWQSHWSFVAPVRPAGAGIDTFVAARLGREGLKMSPEADRRALIRRVSFDLAGLPPTPAEIAAFVGDLSPNAYEKVVDRLLASPRYGERMAMRWLDAARYADTNGYQTDAERSMWRWRDWVIDAFNRNKPYSEFTVEQLAGDLLLDATPDQIIATGFNRNHRTNGEGGIIPEEYAMEYVVDRVDTTSTVWLGLTLGCARCHNHKYDPLTQKEFYQMFAYFNQVPERGNAFKYGNSPPFIAAPLPEQTARLQDLDRAIAAAEQRVKADEPRARQAQAAWAAKQVAGRIECAPSRDVAVDLPLAGTVDGVITPDPPRSERYLYLMENGPLQQAVAFTGKAQWKGRAQFDGTSYIDVGNVGNFGFYDSFTLAARINPTASFGAILSHSLDEAEGKGFALVLKDGKLAAYLIQRWLDDGVRVESKATVPLNRSSHVAMTYDGSRLASGVRLYIDGRPVETTVLLDYMNQPFDVKQPFRVGAGLGPENRFRGAISDVHVYRAALRQEELTMLAQPPNAAPAVPFACFIDRYAPAEIKAPWTSLFDLRDQRQRLTDSFPTVMVMQDRRPHHDTHVLLRGAYDRPGEGVAPGVPSVLPPLAPGALANRLTLAQWIVDPANPLTARVAVNRFWQQYFGTGIVKTVEDFGSQGEPPSNPELLDWLATEFVRTKWDVKALQKTIVMSATYRQSSKVSPQLLQKDPDNRLLARGPRVRLSAEMVRDQALAVSGLLVEKIGGPSVKPYQPAGLWKELAGGDDYKPDHGDALHRRSLYTYWKRTAPPPMMMNFDAAGREACVVRELRTNTPLQSLNLMNDVTYLEASRRMAERMMREGGSTPAGRIAYGFELATSRAPVARESATLAASFAYHRDRFQSDRAAALKYLQQGEAPRDEKLDRSELAAYTAVASMLLNLDATLTKN